MKLLRALLAFAVILLFVTVGALFGKANSNEVPLAFLDYQITTSLAEVVTIAFGVGLILGAIMTCLAGWWTLRRRLAALRREFNARSESTAMTRTTPSADV